MQMISRMIFPHHEHRSVDEVFARLKTRQSESGLFEFAALVVVYTIETEAGALSGQEIGWFFFLSLVLKNF